MKKTNIAKFLILSLSALMCFTACKKDPVSSETPASSEQAPASSEQAPASSETPVSSEETPASSEEAPTSSEETPVSSEPVSSEPVSSEPESSEPVSSEPESSEPVSSEPESSEPAPVPGEAVTVSKTMTELITANGWKDSTTKQSFNLDNVVSVKVNGGSNSGKAYGGNHIRIYATDTPAGSLTFTLASGYELVSIKISAQTGTYAFLKVNGEGEDICNKTVQVSGSSVVLNSVKNGTDGKQVRITAIEVVYQAA